MSTPANGRKEAIKEAKKYCTVNIAARPRTPNFTLRAEQENWNLDPDAAYLHLHAERDDRRGRVPLGSGFDAPER